MFVTTPQIRMKDHYILMELYLVGYVVLNCSGFLRQSLIVE